MKTSSINVSAVTAAMLIHSSARATVVDFGYSFYSSYLGISNDPGVVVMGSPFVLERSKMSEFYLEDFEDHQLNTPYVTSVTGYPAPYGQISTRSLYEQGLGAPPQSVDGDDGVLDGHGMLGDSWFGQVTLQFSPNASGKLPNYAGLVITSGNTYAPGLPIPAFEAYGPNGEFLMDLSISPATFLDDGNGGVDTKGDTFVGLYASEGISRLQATPFLAVQIDHLQYGWSIPEPGATVVLGLALLFPGLRRQRPFRETGW